jgi:hypothetical protein
VTDWQNRQAVILALAHEQGPVNMGAIRAALPYWSPETLRTDCAALVRAGRLRPVGERKGRRYAVRNG